MNQVYHRSATVKNVLQQFGYEPDRVERAVALLEGASSQPNTDPLMASSSLCKRLSISSTTLWRLVQRGLPFHQVGGRKRFRMSEVMQFLDGQGSCTEAGASR